jgi:hypothetical protein
MRRVGHQLDCTAASMGLTWEWIAWLGRYENQFHFLELTKGPEETSWYMARARIPARNVAARRLKLSAWFVRRHQNLYEFLARKELGLINCHRAKVHVTRNCHPGCPRPLQFGSDRPTFADT